MKKDLEFPVTVELTEDVYEAIHHITTLTMVNMIAISPNTPGFDRVVSSIMDLTDWMATFDPEAKEFVEDPATKAIAEEARRLMNMGLN
jgi:hypothetical protein